MIKIKKPNQMTTRRPTVHCRGYLPVLEGAVMMLYSGGGVGKSFAAIREAIEYVKDTGRKAILWLTEDPEGENRNRYDRLIKQQGKSRDFFDSRIDFVTESPMKLTKLQDGNAILTDEFWQMRLELFDYGFVVLDPLLQFHGGDENNNTHAGVMMGALKDWADEENKTIFLLHHATANPNRGGIKPRGAGEFVNGTRGCYEIQKIVDDSYSATEKKDFRKFSLVKDNGISYHFRNEETGECEKELLVFPPLEECKEYGPRQGFVRMSIANHNDVKNAKGFEPTEVPFNEIHKYVMSGVSYSAFLFEGGHRKSENNLGYSDFLCLDFDEGMTLDQAEKKFFHYRCLIVTTKSHQKDGKGDRFRVFLKLAKPLSIPAHDFADFMTALFDVIGSVDPATKDMARVFLASPEDAIYKYSQSSQEFNWEKVYTAVKKKKVFEGINKRRRIEHKRDFTARELENTLPKDTMFTTQSGGNQSFEGFRDTLSYGAKEIVQCVKGHGHNGGQGPDKNPAAFVKKHTNGNVFYHCSGAKCAHEGALFCAE